MRELAKEQLIQPRVSHMAANLVGSEIIRLAGEINERIRRGEQVFNLTIGDFNPSLFPIPGSLNEHILEAYRQGHTNYPPANGMAELRLAISKLIETEQGLSYTPDEYLVAGGARPLIYALYRAIVDPADKVLFPVPSWNNNHYTHLSSGQELLVETTPEDNFMPTADRIRPFLNDVALLALCSPLNPTGTAFSRKALEEICDLVIAENESRKAIGRKPLYILYDQIYWQLTFGSTRHEDPVNLRPALRDCTIYVDGMSKAYAATGVRVGWAFGPADIIGKMRAILGHVGAWAPKAEQVASARFLSDKEATAAYMSTIKSEVFSRLEGLFQGIMSLKAEGYKVNAIAPQAAIYLTAQFDLKGLRTEEGKLLESTEDVTAYLLDKARVAVVPFYAFGAPRSSVWYRISVGTISKEEIPAIISGLRNALSKLS